MEYIVVIFMQQLASRNTKLLYSVHFKVTHWASIHTNFFCFLNMLLLHYGHLLIPYNQFLHFIKKRSWSNCFICFI